MKADEQVQVEKGKEKKANGSSKPDRVFRLDEKREIEALIREQRLSIEQAEDVVRGVKAEIKNQNLPELSRETLREMIDLKVTEIKHKWSMVSEGKKPEPSSDYQVTENARRVLVRRYLKKDSTGKPTETPEHMFRRVAEVIAAIDRNYSSEADVEKTRERFYRLMTSCEFMPNSPTLMNAGRDLGQLSACFVIPVDDSLDSIFEAVKHTAMIHKSGGGTGFSFSRLRPRNDVVKTTSGVASGPLSFMRVFDSATEEIKQGGTRRGANMGILNVDHPDVLAFIHCKEDTTKLTNFNISVGLTEEFMKAVEAGADYPLRNPRSGEPVGSLPARQVFNEIVDCAWRTGEPGIIFIDRLNADNPTPHEGRIESTNPCGEQPLLPYESCNLGSINLAKMVKNGKVDWEKLAGVVHDSVHFLDNVIDANRYPIDVIEQKTKRNRKIGLGIMGWADMLVQLGVPYNSEEAIKLAEETMGFIRAEGRKKSAELAAERGPFPSFEGSKYDQPGQPPLRNATITTIAPTGTISIICGASSGIEPYFAVSYIRTCMDNDELVEVNPLFEKIARERGFYSEALMKEIAQKGSLQSVEGIPDDVKRLFVTAMDMTPEWHVRMQAAFQTATDNAVSKTVNFPKEATREDIAQVYNLSYQLGLKGVTVYRDGSRENQVLAVKKEEKKGAPETVTVTVEVPGKIVPRPRPDTVTGVTRKMPTGCGSLYVTINEDEHGLFEVFTNMGKAGGCASSQAEAVSRLISMALRSGIKAEEIVRQLKGISCPEITWWENGQKIYSCADAIAKAIELYPNYRKNGSHPVDDVTPAGKEATPQVVHDCDPREPACAKCGEAPVARPAAICPDCGGQVVKEEGCLKCHLCGFSKC